MVPRSLGEGEVGSEAIELLTRLAEQWYPGVENVEELDDRERKLWIRFREGVLRSHHGIAALARSLGEAIEKEAAAAVEDRAQLRDERATRLRRELVEREIWWANRTRLETLLIVIAAIGFACAVLLVMAGALTGQVAAYGGSGLLGSVAAASVARLLRLYREESASLSPAEDAAVGEEGEK